MLLSAIVVAVLLAGLIVPVVLSRTGRPLVMRSKRPTKAPKSPKRATKPPLRLVVRPENGLAPAAASGFNDGLASLALEPGSSLIWLWALLLGGSLAAAGGRTLAVVLPGAALALAFAGWQPNPALGLAGSLGIAFAALVPVAANRPLALLIGLSVAQSVGDLPGLSSRSSAFQFELGRALGFAVLLLVAAPIARIVARRPSLKRKLSIGLVCAALFCFGWAGFSLVQSLRAF